MSPFWLVMVSFSVGALVGWFVTVQFRAGKTAAKLQAELDDMKAMHEQYKEDVDRHFVQTSSLVNNLTQSYKEVHDHLSKGAQTLCSNDLAQMLQQTTTPLIADVIDGEKADEAEDSDHPDIPADISVEADEQNTVGQTADAARESTEATQQPADGREEKSTQL